MKKSFFYTILLICLLAVPFYSSAQVAIFDYMKVDALKVDEYLQLEQEWKKVHAERIKVGLIKGWYLYKVRFAGTESEYQYVTVNLYNNFDDSENLFFEGVYEKAWGGQDVKAKLANTEKVRNLLKSEVFMWIDGVNFMYYNPAKYLYMNFINVQQGEENRYVDIEKYVWKPVHEELTNTRQMASWSLWNLWFYTHNRYRYITMNAFYDYDQIDNYNYSDVFQKIHKGKDLDLMFKNTTSSRVSTKSELWELVDYISEEKK